MNGKTRKIADMLDSFKSTRSPMYAGLVGAITELYKLETGVQSPSSSGPKSDLAKHVGTIYHRVYEKK